MSGQYFIGALSDVRRREKKESSEAKAIGKGFAVVFNVARQELNYLYNFVENR